MEKLKAEYDMLIGSGWITEGRGKREKNDASEFLHYLIAKIIEELETVRKRIIEMLLILIFV